MIASDPQRTDEATQQLTEDLAHSARLLFAAGGVEQTLAQVVGLAVETIEGCDVAGIFLQEGTDGVLPVHTHELVLALDALQRQTSQGPCLDAIAASLTLYASDLASDLRWPEFSALAVQLGVRSALVVPLLSTTSIGALVLYATLPQAFGVVDRGRAQLLAGLAAVAYSVAQSHEVQERRALGLQAALHTRELIGQAQGILIERERITPEQAFDVLRRASQHLNVKLREVAHALVETGERPTTGAPDEAASEVRRP